ncbi:alpha/beta fold hydrolase [Rhizobium sp.]|jgi:pimeloyl-ACP methyl ester carboxylesterase|uniref:alpha/beta fold hydrolase n=1 Tax=Rhizobium sp. TaxID=391 RepID=UPI000E8FE2F9|nr:alpha/beta hydrolase [Rhizobium sp.]
MESIADKVGMVSGQRQSERQKAAAQPVNFAATFGLFQPANGVSAHAVRNAAVLFLPPWGFEELCTHKLFRLMAEEFAADGIASLRFDYPGTGDALDDATGAITLNVWQDTISQALALLQERTGGLPVILVGHGLGASLALAMAHGLEGLCGLVAMAPVVSGRTYLRELQFWARVIDDGLGLPEHLRIRGGTSIGGIIMPDGVSAALKKKDFSAASPHRSIPHLFVNRLERPGDKMLSEQMAAKGARVELSDYIGFDAMIANPSMARLPLETMENLVSWVVRLAAGLGRPDHLPLANAVVDTARLETRDFCETAMRFGRGQRLYGILCEPVGARRGATVLLASTAYDRQAGWGRSGVAMARRLARVGIASFRFDPANVGDSPPVPGFPEQVLYAETQYDDVEAALNVLEERDLLPAIGVGRCSGGYLTFSSMLKDHRLVGACLANAFAFYWDPRRDVDGVLRVVPRSLNTYRQLMFRGGTFRRLICGDVDIKNAVRNFISVGWSRFIHSTGLGNIMSARARLAHAQVMSAFKRLAKRKVKLILLYSENDVGLEHVYQHFGAHGRGLKRYDNVQMQIVPETDHNFSPESAQQRYFEEIRDLALSAGSTAIRLVDYPKA